MSEKQIPQIDFDENFMAEALKEATKAGKEDEVPVGCVIVHEGKIIGRGHNRTLALQDPTAHAEILAITAASEHLNSWRLSGCTVYGTIEPCIMCAGALVLARVDRLVYGATDPKFGACESLYNIVQDTRLNHRIPVSGGILKDQCAKIMQEFFRKKRRNDS
ncbi:MAG: nucleoside deaminase [Candidatus Zixiibacteriota bacterium]|nr:MAG: nucleoside deaminase [candidate division Zixibacteria bacterium]